MAKKNKRYMDLLHESGVLASEMECSHLFILGEVFNQQLRTKNSNEKFLTGGVLSIIGDDSAFAEGNEERVEKAIQDGIMLSLETVKCLAERELA